MKKFVEVDLSTTNTANLVADRRISGLNSLKIADRQLTEVEDGILSDRLRESMKENRGMRAESGRPGKRPLRALSAVEKIEAIQRVHDGESKASVARDIGVPESTLRGWCKSETKIRGMARNCSTPDSEAHSPASSSGANISNSQNPGANHSSEDEGPLPKKMKSTDHQVPVSLPPMGVENTESSETKIESKNYDYLKLMSLAASMRPENSALFLQHLGMMSANAKNYMSVANGLPHSSAAVGLVENGLQYTRSPMNTSTSNKRYSLSAVAPTQMDSLSKSTTRKSLPAAAEAPATPVPASPNVQMSTLHSQGSHSQIGNQRKNGGAQNWRTDDVLWMWLTQQQQQQQQQSAPFNPSINQEGALFWEWYKQSSIPASSPSPVVQNSVTKRSPSKAKAMLDNILCNNNNNENVKRSLNVEEEVDDVPNTIEEAIEHGEKFFKWLHKCSDPSVTMVRIMQFKVLLDNLKDCKRRRATPGSKRSRK